MDFARKFFRNLVKDVHPLILAGLFVFFACSVLLFPFFIYADYRYKQEQRRATKALFEHYQNNVNNGIVGGVDVTKDE